MSHRDLANLLNTLPRQCRSVVLLAVRVVFTLLLILPAATIAQQEAAEAKTIASVLLNINSRYFTEMDDATETEIIGFGIARRNLVSTQVSIPDMEVVLAADGERWIPLIRLLYAFDLGIDGGKHDLNFQPEFVDAVRIDLAAKTITYAGAEENLEFVAGFSEITGTREIFLSPATISRIFDIEIVWEDDFYQYNAVTDNYLKIWKLNIPKYALDEAELVGNELPSKFGTAEPANNSLDYVQTRVAASVNASRDGDTRALFSTSQDFWGGVFGGRYQLRFQQPNISWSDGTGIESGDENLSVPRRALWTKTNKKNEITLGDSSFAVNELVLPFVNFTGLRVGGLFGSGSDENNETDGFGPNSRFESTQRYEGIAELGSTVTLFINDSQIATAEVYEEPDSAVGFGRYTFDEITIPKGNLVAIRIEIEEPNGRRVVRDLSTTNTSKLRPAGQFSYIAGVGTERDTTQWDSSGVLGAGRLLYGVNRALTVGVTAGYQQDSGEQFSETISSSSRARPDKSTHYGVEFVAQPLSKVLLSAAAATSAGTAQVNSGSLDERYEGESFTMDLDYFLHRRVGLHGRAYRYEPNFYNGIDVGLEDRQGYYIRSRANLPYAGLSVHYGSIENNIDDQFASTLRSDYYGLNVSTTKLLPGAFLWAEFDTVEPQNFDPKTFVSGGLRTTLRGFNLSGQLSNGDLFELDQPIRDLFQNVALPDLRITGSPSSSLSISKGLGAHRFVMDFDGQETNFDQRGRFTHYWDRPHTPGAGFWGAGALRVVTEIGYNENVDTKFISNRLNLYLDQRRNNRLGMVSSYDSQSGWAWSLDMNLTNIFAFRSGRVINVSASTASPGIGGTSGVVFFDKNANGVQDWGERGLRGIRLKASDVFSPIVTDKYGEFFISRRSNQARADVYIDIDSVPATLIPVHARQDVRLKKGLTSRVEFALAPMVSLTGLLLSPEMAPDDNSKPAQRYPIGGARIELTDQQGAVVAESITASDGSYFFNAIPGEYQMWVDPQTVHETLTFNEPAFSAKVVGLDEFQELEFEPIYAEFLTPSSNDTIVVARDSVQLAEPAQQMPAPDDAVSAEAASLSTAEQSNSETIINLTQPKIVPKKDINKSADDNYVGIQHQVSGTLLGQKIDRSGFKPLAGVTILLLERDGTQRAVTETDASGIYRFEMPAGSYSIALDPLSVPIEYVYEVPAMAIKVRYKERPQKITLKPINAFYLELDY